MTFAFSPAPLGVGASGAIFGLFGLLVAADRIHRPILDRHTRGFLGQLTALVVFNLFLGFILRDIDNFAHIGGLVTGWSSACSSSPAGSRRSARCGCGRARRPGRPFRSSGSGGAT